MGYEYFPVRFEDPVYICECCGNMLRLMFSEEDDEIQCDFCGSMMTKTDRRLSEEEGSLMYYSTRDARIFRRDIFQKYVKNSPWYDSRLHAARETEWKRKSFMYF